MGGYRPRWFVALLLVGELARSIADAHVGDLSREVPNLNRTERRERQIELDYWQEALEDAEADLSDADSRYALAHDGQTARLDFAAWQPCDVSAERFRTLRDHAQGLPAFVPDAVDKSAELLLEVELAR